MKKQPLPPSLKQSGWSANQEENLLDSAASLYQKIADKEEKEADRGPKEATAMLEILLSKPELVNEIESANHESLLAKRISLWMEQPQISQAATELGCAAPEAEAKFFLTRDLVEIELHRRKAIQVAK